MTMTTHPQPGDLPAWHSTFAASAEVATATVHARGTLDLFTVDLLQGAIDVLTPQAVPMSSSTWPRWARSTTPPPGALPRPAPC